MFGTQLPQEKTMQPKIKRRHFLAGTALAAAALPVATAVRAEKHAARDDKFPYEIQRTEDEWRAMLSKDEYNILRKNSTELPKTSPLWEEARDGEYACRGCNLPTHTSFWKEQLDMGWVFFQQSIPNSIMMNIDGANPYGMSDSFGALIEAHCRRCGSHLGHILKVGDKTLHCINGTSLIFTPASA
jgi:peptide-methionine (R)-S-oxide reductase